MAKLNWAIIGYHLAEAREQLEAIEKQIVNGKPLTEEGFQLILEDAFTTWHSHGISDAFRQEDTEN